MEAQNPKAQPQANAPKPAAPAARPAAPAARPTMKAGTAPKDPKAAIQQAEKISNIRGIRNAFLVILACAAVAVCIFLFVMGADSNFEEGHPKNLLGTVYKGGFIVPILMTLLLTVIVISIERAIAISSASGKGHTTKFVADIKGARQRCRQQRGSVASVVYNTLVKYQEMDQNTVLSKEQKLTTLRDAVEESTALEMPSLSQNLPIVATLTTLGTLVGLLGTVMGMIKSFQALAASGSPDSTELSTGISEALVNTAFGIATGAFAVISYNFFTNKIDNLTYAIDEIGFSIVATFAATHK